jgi:hypothetical protein
MKHFLQICVFCAAMFAAVPLLYGTPFHNGFVYIGIGVVATWLYTIAVYHWRPPAS